LVPALIFTAGPNAGRRYKLGKGDYIIGRRSDCQIFVPDMRVSRQHALIHRKGKGWVIQDLGSNNGTFVNGKKVQEQILEHEDQIKIAHNVITVDLPEEATQIREPAFDANVTVVDLQNPRVIKSRDEHTQASGLWSATHLAGAQDLQRQQRLMERKLQALTTILEISGRAAKPEELLDAIGDQLLEAFPQARVVATLSEDKAGEFRVISQRRHKRAGDSKETMKVPGPLLANVQNGTQGILLEEPERAFDGPGGLRMGAPVRMLDDKIGVLYIESEHAVFHQEDVDLLTSIANQTGLALHSTHIQREYERQRRFERDLKVARQIQRSLLPAKPPEVVGLEFAVHYEPAYTIGGDFYDFIWHDREHLALVVGDVSGKAISAALYMARLTSELRSRATIARTPATLLRRVNEEMMHLGDDGMFSTLIYAVYDLVTRSLLFSNAGHQVPILRREGKVYALEADSAHVAPLGVFRDMEIGEARVQLQEGDMLILTTDGIQEGRNAKGEEYGAKRLMERIEATRGGPDEVIKAILSDVDNHTRDGKQTDDMTILAMSIGTGRARRRTTVTPVDGVSGLGGQTLSD
jgi:serine phosphatase RsbU (regulator of sigma subunit)/pSer/pThr/pTyr-binding forkhead associated (FHA) protein